MRVAICDDEPLALDRLSSLLERISDVALVGAHTSGDALLEAIPSSRPELVLLDIEMPRTDGFDVAEALSRIDWSPGISPPLVIFVTAHQRFAVAAFDTGALDFINKPIRLTRLERGLVRARTALRHLEACERLRELQAQLEDLKKIYGESEEGGHIWIRRPGESIRVALSSIQWIQAEAEYVRLHCATESYLERVSLAEMEQRLEPAGFVRIHRSTLVSSREVARLETAQWGRSFVQLKNGNKLPIGRKYRSAIRQVQRDLLPQPRAASQAAAHNES